MLIFNDYRNVRLIERAIDKVSQSEYFPNINFKVLSYMEWLKANPENAKNRNATFKKLKRIDLFGADKLGIITTIKKGKYRFKNYPVEFRRKKKVNKSGFNYPIKAKGKILQKVFVYYLKHESIYDLLGYYTDSEYLIVAVNEADKDDVPHFGSSLARHTVDKNENIWHDSASFLQQNLNEAREVFGNVNPKDLIREKDGRIHSTTKMHWF